VRGAGGGGGGGDDGGDAAAELDAVDASRPGGGAAAAVAERWGAAGAAEALRDRFVTGAAAFPGFRVKSAGSDLLGLQPSLGAGLPGLQFHGDAGENVTGDLLPVAPAPAASASAGRMHLRCVCAGTR
jgi:hypothetical protein